jgi:carbon monoxide dehydrogenase subunit G
MTFEQHCIIPVPREELWHFLLDIPHMAVCVPGAENVTAEGEDRYRGSLRVKIGPIRLVLEGAMVIDERDRERWRATAHSEAKDRRLGGGARVSGEMRLADTGPSSTELILSGQVRFLGKLGEFGEPLIRKQADLIIAAFAQNVASRFASAAGAFDGTPIEQAVSEQITASRQSSAERPRQPMSQPRPTNFPWTGVLAGLGVAMFSILAIGRKVNSSWFPQRPTAAAGASLWHWTLRMITTGGLAWIGAKTQRALRERMSGHGGDQTGSASIE